MTLSEQGQKVLKNVLSSGFSPLKNWLAPELEKGPNEAEKAGLEWPVHDQTCAVGDQATCGQPTHNREPTAKFVGKLESRQER